MSNLKKTMEIEIQNFIEALLFKAEIIAFGETHHGTHLDVFKQLFQEVRQSNGLFLEEPVNYQASINTFLQTGVFDEELMKRNNSNIRDENGDLYFDAYIVHKD